MTARAARHATIARWLVSAPVTAARLRRFVALVDADTRARRRRGAR